MPKVKIEKDSNLSRIDTFSRVKNLIENDPGLRKLDAGYTSTFDENSFTGTAKGKQFKATMDVSGDDSKAHVTIEVDLPLILTPFKGQVASTLTRKLEKALS